jgi:hypothetical protein
MGLRAWFLLAAGSLAVACAAGGTADLGLDATEPPTGGDSPASPSPGSGNGGGGGGGSDSGGGGGGGDGSAPDAGGGTNVDAAADGPFVPVLDAAPDAPVGPTAQQCLMGWASYAGACPAPIITSSYVGNGCVGTTGWFIEGQNFQFEKDKVGFADYGPQSIGANGNQKHWNVITTTLLCVTVSAAAKGAWVGHTIHVVNPDGKASNAVVVQDKL